MSLSLFLSLSIHLSVSLVPLLPLFSLSLSLSLSFPSLYPFHFLSVPFTLYLYISFCPFYALSFSLPPSLSNSMWFSIFCITPHPSVCISLASVSVSLVSNCLSVCQPLSFYSSFFLSMSLIPFYHHICNNVFLIAVVARIVQISYSSGKAFFIQKLQQTFSQKNYTVNNTRLCCKRGTKDHVFETNNNWVTGYRCSSRSLEIDSYMNGQSSHDYVNPA